MRWRYRHTVLALCTFAFAATMVARLSISQVVPQITDAFGISKALLGLALSGMWAAYALSQFPSGVLADRYGERRIILIAVGLTALAALCLAISPIFPVFVLFMVVLGAGAGLHYSVATTLFTREFDDIGRAIGLHVSGGPLAGLVTPIVAAFLALHLGWRYAIGFGVAIAFPIFVLFWWRIKPTPPRQPDRNMRERFALGPLVELLSRPKIAYTTALAIAGAFCWQATASFLPAFLAQYHGLSSTTAGALFSLYFVVHGGTQPLMGGLSDRVGRDAMAATNMSIGVVGYAVLVMSVGQGLGPLIGGIVLVGVAMSWGAPVQSRFLDNLGEAERGAGFGLVRTVYMILGASGNVIVGALADIAGWAVAFGLLAGVVGVGFSLLAVNRIFRLGL